MGEEAQGRADNLEACEKEQQALGQQVLIGEFRIVLGILRLVPQIGEPLLLGLHEQVNHIWSNHVVLLPILHRHMDQATEVINFFGVHHLDAKELWDTEEK